MKRNAYIGSAGISGGAPSVPFAGMFPTGTVSFVVPYDGDYKFYLWSGGYHGDLVNGGPSGSYLEITKSLTAGQTVTGSVGRGGKKTVSPTLSTLTFPDTSVVTAGVASGYYTGNRAVATGGNVNLNGSLGGQTPGAAGEAGLGTGGAAAGPGDGSLISGGGGAPANLPMRGGTSYALGTSGQAPGGGGSSSDTNGEHTAGGSGLLIIEKVA